MSRRCLAVGVLLACAALPLALFQTGPAGPAAERQRLRVASPREGRDQQDGTSSDSSYFGALRVTGEVNGVVHHGQHYKRPSGR